MNLTIILGAGAAVDVIPLDEKSPGSTPGLLSLIYKPRVTKDLFQTPQPWETEYSNFPGVESVLGELRTHTNAQSLENYLGDLKDSEEAFERLQFRQFPVYLQHYFSQVSERYCTSPHNYNSLINQASRKNLFRKVAYVTLNYDLLFDKALGRHPKTSPVFEKDSTDIRKYVKADDWIYIKLHGSVNWGRPIDPHWIKNEGKSISAYIDNIDHIGDRLDDALGEIVIDYSYSSGNREPIYPAISVPTGESKVNCPETHLDAFKKHLDTSEHFLVIGFSGYDTDILNLLAQKKGSFKKLVVVSRNKESAENTILNFQKHDVLKDRIRGAVKPYESGGFNDFMNGPTVLEGYFQQKAGEFS